MEQAGTIPAVGASSSIERWRLKAWTYMMRKAYDCFDLVIVYRTLMTINTFFEENEKYFSTAIDGRKVIDYLINT